MKSEPSNYSIDDFKKEGEVFWDGVRNYQARNFMMNDMAVDDHVLFYHSNTKPIGIVGQAVVSQAAKADPTAFDKKSQYFDPKSTKQKPRWFAVSLKFKNKFFSTITLEELKTQKVLQKMELLKKGQRLSVQPVTPTEFKHILKMTETSHQKLPSDLDSHQAPNNLDPKLKGKK